MKYEFLSSDDAVFAKCRDKNIHLNRYVTFCSCLMIYVNMRLTRMQTLCFNRNYKKMNEYKCFLVLSCVVLCCLVWFVLMIKSSFNKEICILIYVVLLIKESDTCSKTFRKKKAYHLNESFLFNINFKHLRFFFISIGFW